MPSSFGPCPLPSPLYQDFVGCSHQPDDLSAVHERGATPHVSFVIYSQIAVGSLRGEIFIVFGLFSNISLVY